MEIASSSKGHNQHNLQQVSRSKSDDRRLALFETPEHASEGVSAAYSSGLCCEHHDRERG